MNGKMHVHCVCGGSESEYTSGWTCHKSHLFHHMRNEVKACRWRGTLISGILVFISETCRSCNS